MVSPAAAIAREDITGLVLAGGRGTRMGGIDKGLQSHRGMPLALHALLRLQMQVGAAMLNANRNLGAYEAMGIPVWPDSTPDFPGPLGGLLAGLEHCETPWLLTVPCDTPNFPPDLAERLAAGAMAAGVPVATAATLEDGQQRAQPVFSLVRADLLESLTAYLHAGQRKVMPWLHQHGAVEVLFEDAAAFQNANTVEDLRRLYG